MKHANFNFDSASEATNLKTTFIPAAGLSLADCSQTDAIRSLLTSGRCMAFFMNAHCCNVLHKDRQYKAAVNRADVLLPDGVGVEMAARMSGKKLTANLNGTDLIPLILKEAAEQGKSVFLFGGTPGTAKKAALNLIEKTPGLRIAGTRDGFAGAADTAEVIADINNSGADIVLVALGVPMQENWLHQNATYLHADLAMGVGAAFDFFAGNVARAPKWVRRSKSEWVWRLAMEPRRMAKRYLSGNLTFLARAAAATVRQASSASIARRILDVTIAASALVVLAPVLAITAIAVKVESKGTILFKQTRIGKDGVPFTMIKFRSMVQNAEELRSGLLETSDREGVCFKSKDDPRITRIGRFIRRTSIDELPQFLNVFKGEMSIVGPRPSLPSEVQAYPAHAYGRLAVKPGITGVWQVSGRANISFDRMIDMDLAYADSRTVLLDLIVIALTFRAVFSGRGAH